MIRTERKIYRYCILLFLIRISSISLDFGDCKPTSMMQALACGGAARLRGDLPKRGP